MKRILDMFGAVLLLVMLLPLFVVLFLVLSVTGERKVFYLQKRIGHNQRPFKIIKFATMLENSPNIGSGDITVKNDPRVLPVGQYLRKTKVNELPQLFNVIKGEMSFVGPRPLTPKHFGFFSHKDRELISQVRPGVTGMSSLVFRDEEKYFNELENPAEFYKVRLAPTKAKIECYYRENVSMKLDFMILLLTIFAVLRPTSQYPVRQIEKITGFSTVITPNSN